MGSSTSKSKSTHKTPVLQQNPYSTTDSVYNIGVKNRKAAKQIDWLTIMKPGLGLNKVDVITQSGITGVKFKAYLAEYAGAPFDLYVFTSSLSASFLTTFIKFVRHCPNHTIELRGIWVKYPGTNAFVVTSYFNGKNHVNC
jgi:hypothetical protein